MTSKCSSCGLRILKRDSEIFERIGLCQKCAWRELEPLVNSLVDVFSTSDVPDNLSIAKGYGWDAYYEAVSDLSLRLYEAGWRLTRNLEQNASATLPLK